MLYPIGIQSFSEIRRRGFVYVDKTAGMYKMVSEGKYYFLSRPRRFGKSLLVSTLKEYFLGHKEMFEGLAVAELEKDWIEYPVLHLDLNTKKYIDKSSLNEILNEHLEIWEALYGDEKKQRSPEERFSYLIQQAYNKTGRNVVILVDEYDKPMLQAIGNEELQNEYRSTLKAFYGALKSCDEYIQFALLTGVTKFGKASVFSDLNNLIDLSMDSRFYDICGVSCAELHDNFDAEVGALAERNSETKEEAYEHLRVMYDGYHFSEDTPGMYNPFSLLNTLSRKKYGSYWFETGTPTFLVELLQNKDFNLETMSRFETDADSLNSIFTDDNPLPVIFQSGYLTIKGYDKRFGLYKLGFPNKEVEDGFVKFLMPYYTSKDKIESPFEISRFVNDVQKGNADGFMSRLQSFFANAKFDHIAKDTENWFQNVIFIVTTLAGFYVEAERQTSRGRIDLVLKTDRYIYIIELKFDGSAEEALAQIDTKGYCDPYRHDGRTLIRIGANFSSELRNIEKWIIG